MIYGYIVKALFNGRGYNVEIQTGSGRVFKTTTDTQIKIVDGKTIKPTRWVRPELGKQVKVIPNPDGSLLNWLFA